MLAIAIAAYIFVRNDAYLRLDAALQVATGATAMSAAHELGEHPTKLGGERDLQLVLEEGGSSALADTEILVREGYRTPDKSGTPHSFDLRNIPPEKLANGVTFHGSRIATRNLVAPKFNTVYQVYAAKPITSALAPLVRIRIGLFVSRSDRAQPSGGSGYLLAKKSLHPLKQLAQTVDGVTYSDLSARVKLSDIDDEIGTRGGDSIPCWTVSSRHSRCSADLWRMRHTKSEHPSPSHLQLLK